MKIAVVLGTRPEIIKMQPIIHEIQNRNHELILIHTGQHFDFEMSDIFVNELNLPKPNYFLKVRSSSQGVQTGSIIAKCERILKAENPQITLVEGDTNSALGASIASSKLAVPIGHVEAGCRSFNKAMPEEINRVLISHIANLHFAPTKNCMKNLLREGLNASDIFLSGHPLVDLMNYLRTKIPDNSNSTASPYALVTIHRRENITDKEKLTNIFRAISKVGSKIQLIFPCHPHTRLRLFQFGLSEYLANLTLTQPVGYLDSLGLIKHARYVLTDSGGIQQEAAILDTPCITLRTETEWVETTQTGVNFLAGNTTKRILKSVSYVNNHRRYIMTKFKSKKDLFGKVGTSKQIIKTIERYIKNIDH